SLPRALGLLARLALLAAGILLGIVAVVVVALETPWGVRTVAGFVLGLVDPWPDARFEVRGAAAGFLGGLELHGVRLVSTRGEAIGTVDTVRVEYQMLQVLKPGHRLQRGRVAGLTLDATRWPSTRPSTGPPGPRSATPVIIVDGLEVRRGVVRWRM